MTICTKVPHLEQGTDNDNTKQTQTLAMICEQYPPEDWTNVYTDGSVTNAIQDSGTGIVIYLYSGSTESASAATRRHYCNYKAESEAVLMATSLVVDSQQKSTMAVFLTDALSVLQVLTNNKLPHIAEARYLLYSATTAEWPFIGYPPNAEFLELNKQTRPQSKVYKQSNQVLM